MILGLLSVLCLATTQVMAQLILHGTLKPTKPVQATFYGAIVGATILGGLWMDDHP